MTRYGFRGPSGQFYPLADDPLTAQHELTFQGIDSPLIAVEVALDEDWLVSS